MSTNNVLSSHQTVAPYMVNGISKTELHSMLISSLNISADITFNCLHKYVLRYWSGKHFKDQVSQGTLEFDGVSYLICYKDITPAIAFKARQLKISFRKAKDIYGLPPYVLVSGVDVSSSASRKEERILNLSAGKDY